MLTDQYDYFIFKRDEKDEPYLDLIIKEKNEITFSEDQNSQKQILMLQLLLNFSAPNYFAQDWLAVALSWLDKNFDQKDVYNLFSQELEKFDRTMALKRLTDEPDLTGLVNGYLINKNKVSIFDESNFEDKAQLNRGTATAHYWFYKLDYLLWKNDSIWKDLKCEFTENDKFKYTLIKTKFRLSRLNSIEHIYPQSKEVDWQNPNNNYTNIDKFGNLALISNHMNSALIDKDNENKKLKIQEQLNNGTIESLKMVLIYSKYEEWTSENCKEHQEEMINILIEDLKSC